MLWHAANSKITLPRRAAKIAMTRDDKKAIQTKMSFNCMRLED